MIKIDKSDVNIWFTSDTHYWHKNITYGESVWSNKETGCRRFDTTQQMSQHIVSQINKYVKHDDILFHLGDWSFGGINNIWNFRGQLVCQNIHLILGNHDHHIEHNKDLLNYPHFPAGCPAHYLFLSVQHYLEIMIDGQMACLSHYPMSSWNDRHHSSFMLHGHEHGNNTSIPKRLDVGIDNAYKMFGEYKPFKWNEIKILLK